MLALYQPLRSVALPARLGGRSIFDLLPGRIADRYQLIGVVVLHGSCPDHDRTLI